MKARTPPRQEAKPEHLKQNGPLYLPQSKSAIGGRRSGGRWQRLRRAGL